jgi:hypothetical protein
MPYPAEDSNLQWCYCRIRNDRLYNSRQL